MPGISVEISTGGMSAMVSGLLSEGEMVELDPVVGGRATARVRHKLGRLYGFEFVDLTAEQLAQIAERCHRFSGYRVPRRVREAREVGRGHFAAKVRTALSETQLARNWWKGAECNQSLSRRTGTMAGGNTSNCGTERFATLRVAWDTINNLQYSETTRRSERMS
jgi:hypothetical protein